VIQIHGLILSCKGRKTFAWCALQAETSGFIFFIFGFAETVSAVRSASAASSLPWGCHRALSGAQGQCTRGAEIGVSL